MACSTTTKRLLATSLPPASLLQSRLYGSFALARCASCGAARSAPAGLRREEKRPYATTQEKKAEGSSLSFPEPPTHNALASTLDQQLKSALRALLREVAQPVAVVTSFMPNPPRSSAVPAHGHPPRIPLHSHHLHGQDHQAFHGATLSSLSSIAMDPHPLIAFALRVPSRMAATLSSFAPATLSLPTSPSLPSPTAATTTTPQNHPRKNTTHLVLNILSDSQHPLAHAFSRPDLHPHPFGSASHTLNADGLPILDGSLGALACKIVGRVKLSELVEEEEEDQGGGEGERVFRHRGGLGRRHEGVISELFIARVVRVENVSAIREGGKEEDAALPLQHEGVPTTTPLLYWRRGYTSCRQS